MAIKEAFKNKEIRDTTRINSSVETVGDIDSILVAVRNGLNQSVTVVTEGSFDGATWFPVDTSFSVAAGATGTNTFAFGFPRLRVGVTAAAAPTTGDIAVWTRGRSRGLG